MAYFPFFVDIGGKNGLIAGGGRVALHKLQKLLPYGAKLQIVAPEVSEAMERTALENDICVIKRAFEPSDLNEMFFVIAASDDAKVNAEIGRLCRERGILVNVVDDKEACSFLFPSLVKEGNLSIGISTEGTSPEVAAELRSSRVHDTRRYGYNSCVSGQPQTLGKGACEGYGQTCCISKGYGAGVHGHECGI